MKITREEFENGAGVTDAAPLDLFRQGIRAEATRAFYTRTLRRILCDILEDVLEGTFEQRAAQFVRLGVDEPNRLLGLLLQISRKLRERSELPHDHKEYMNPSSIHNYFKPIKKLLDMNDVAMKWKRVNATFPERDNLMETRGWERSEIQQILGHAKSLRDKAIVLVAASSGMRAGGFELLRWSDLRPLYRGDDGRLGFGDGVAAGSPPACAMLTVYGRTSASYPAFITPEAYAAIMTYRGIWARDVGRQPKPSEPLFKNNWDRRPIAVSASGVNNNVDRMAKAAGLRSPGQKSRRRYNVPIMNGFRRFWNKTCKESVSGESSLAALIKKEYMMGHVGLVNLDRNYFKTHVLELAEEYVHSVSALTIGNEERLRLENERQAGRIGRMQDERDVEIAALKRTVEEMARRMEEARNGGGGDGGS